jgi:hypothetical protein
MTQILVDKALRQLERIDQVPVRGEMRYYYVASEDALFHLVSRVGPVRLLDTPCVVDASIGWGEGWHGKCHPSHEGLKLAKVTLRHILDVEPEQAEKTLSQIIEDSRGLRRQPYSTPRWSDAQ